MVTMVSNFRPSSCWAGATSWWCFSGFMPSRHHGQHFAAQVLAESTGLTGK
jgi:hypothetical protein